MSPLARGQKPEILSPSWYPEGGNLRVQNLVVGGGGTGMGGTMDHKFPEMLGLDRPPFWALMEFHSSPHSSWKERLMPFERGSHGFESQIHHC